MEAAEDEISWLLVPACVFQTQEISPIRDDPNDITLTQSGLFSQTLKCCLESNKRHDFIHKFSSTLYGNTCLHVYNQRSAPLS